MEILFGRIDGSLKATPLADMIYERLLVIRDSYDRMRKEIRGRGLVGPSIVRLATTRTIGSRIIAAALSGWKNVFAKDGESHNIELKIYIQNSFSAIDRLQFGGFDVLVCYGDATSPYTSEALKHVAFRSLGFSSRMILLCHPAAELPVLIPRVDLTNPHDANAGYWDHLRKHRTNREYNNLRSIRLDEIDFSKTKLILTPSLNQPLALDSFYQSLDSGKKLQVYWYDEALALARIGRGIAVTSESFRIEERVTAFRLDPIEAFARQIGILYHSKRGLNASSCMVITFLMEYFKRFEPELRAINPPAIGDRSYENFCKAFNLDRDWESISKDF